MFKLSVVFVVRFYCSNEDVEYGFNFKLLRDETIKVIHVFRTNIGVNYLLANQSIQALGCPSTGDGARGVLEEQELDVAALVD